MGEPARLELTVLGEKLTIRTEASADYLASLAAYLEERVGMLTAGNRTQTAAIILAALDITDELFRARDEKVREEGHVDARLRTLLTELRRATE